MQVTITAYCDEDDIDNRLSEAGVALRVDDIPPDDLGESIDRAAIRIYEYLGLVYPDSQLSGSNVVKHWCADIATYFVCTRRGNPAPGSISKAYEEVIAKLERYQKGWPQLPDAAPRATMVPGMENINYRLTPAPHPRVQRKRSTTKEPTDYTRRNDYSDPAEWGAADWSI